MIRRPPRSTPLYSSAASDVYKRQAFDILISIIAAFCCLYIYFFYDELVNRGGILLVKEAGGSVTDFSGGNNTLFGRELVAAGDIHNDLLKRVQKYW